jgi:hypothetical protein
MNCDPETNGRAPRGGANRFSFSQKPLETPLPVHSQQNKKLKPEAPAKNAGPNTKKD